MKYEVLWKILAHTFVQAENEEEAKNKVPEIESIYLETDLDWDTFEVVEVKKIQEE